MLVEHAFKSVPVRGRALVKRAYSVRWPISNVDAVDRLWLSANDSRRPLRGDGDSDSTV